MKSITDVLNEKEARIEVLRSEIEALQAAARILAETGDVKPPLPNADKVAVISKNWP
ncbi:MAG: hypothetical protein ACE14L_06450 [Terriglobales bacterium]